ncbi:HigA family addiction module antidote protein [Microbacterium sp. YMB-B2]|uniref:HigA family addiction module antidote protein n=2 Tax=Microbacterium tenebrionis TaxID=2830665 RepID=A0A9X1LR55_9MICO|nr:HigA family addiction module antidote protein [Microbacterium tenebrionis]
MYDPPHPGEIIADVYLAEWEMSARELAIELGVAPSTLNRILNRTARVTPEMALRLSKALGASAESWLTMQQAYDLWHARQTVDLAGVRRIERPAA